MSFYNEIFSLIDWDLFWTLEIIAMIEGIAILILIGLLSRWLLKIPRDIFDLPERLVDVTISIVGLTFFSLIFIVLAILFRFGPKKSRGPLFYSEIKSGLNNKPFKIYKFRTMVTNNKDLTSQLQDKNIVISPFFYIPSKHDPRIHSNIGYLLKKTAIDEIPVLINVFKGHMALIGPRPLNFEEMNAVSNLFPRSSFQKKRSSLKPGFISLWDTRLYTLKPSLLPTILQKRLRKKDKWIKEWMLTDLVYAKNRCTILDIKIFLKYILIEIGRLFLPVEEIVEKEEMNKTRLVSEVAAKVGISKRDAQNIIDAFTKAIINSLSKREKVALVGFGTFQVIKKKARKGRNPQTGETIEIPAKKVPKFVPGKDLREKVK